MKLTVLPGDGIGPEVTREALKVLEGVSTHFGFEVEISEGEIGGVAITSNDDPFPASTAEMCLNSEAVLLGAVGAPEFDGIASEKRPEAGLLRLRKTLGGFANLRPAKAFPALINSSPLRPEIFKGTDMLIVRELLGGIYFGEPRGFSEDNNSGFNTLVYSREEVRRIARKAFELAGTRRGKVCSVDKSNVLEASRLWRECVIEVKSEFPEIELEHMYVDACAMRLVTNPTSFDVVVTSNMFGDILSDESAVLTGSLGMLPSATVGGEIDLFEPVHGSAPDIAGKSIANPLGAIGCIAMMLRETFDQFSAAEAIEKAIETVLAEGFRTKDIYKGGTDIEVRTEDMGDLVTRQAIENVSILHQYHAV
ncbi:MAG: 3-isopropylmalate dehydrogenase [Pyrinomonadaceae bacterium]